MSKEALEKHLRIMEDMEKKLKKQLQSVSERTPLPGSPTNGGITMGEALKRIQEAQIELKDTIRILEESRRKRKEAERVLEESRRKRKEAERELQRAKVELEPIEAAWQLNTLLN